MAFATVASLTARPVSASAAPARRGPRALRAGGGAGDLLKGARVVRPEGAPALGCPDSETGTCEPAAPRTDALLGSPDSVTGLVSTDFDELLEAQAQGRGHTAKQHRVGGHMIHSEAAHPATGCPDSESGLCDLDNDEQVYAERGDLGAWEF